MRLEVDSDITFKNVLVKFFFMVLRVLIESKKKEKKWIFLRFGTRLYVFNKRGIDISLLSLERKA